MKRKVLWVVIFLFAASSVCLAQNFGVKKKEKRPSEYGNVVMNNLSEKNNMAPVVFNHWLHRALYTCKVCHVDIGFGMKADSTGVTEADNKNGMYCGACHNNVEAFGMVQKDAMGNEAKQCDRCHSYGKSVKFEKEFYEFVKPLPKTRYGNRVDWMASEEMGLVKIKDFLEGYTFRAGSLQQDKEISIKSKEMGIEDIIFSHKKHTVWNGCELCHPEIFGVKKGSTKYTMQDIFEGKFCGACHGIVAFPNADCMLCHAKPVY